MARKRKCKRKSIWRAKKLHCPRCGARAAELVTSPHGHPEECRCTNGHRWKL